MKGNIRCKASSWPYARQSVWSFAGEEEMEKMLPPAGPERITTDLSTWRYKAMEADM